MASVAPEDAAGQPLVQATLVGEQGSLEITLKKPAADAKVGVSLVGSPPLVHQVRAGGLGAAAGLRLHDRVVSVNGLPVSGQDDAVAALAAAPPGPLVVVVEPREPPPNAPGGGHYLREHHCGDNAWLEVCCGCGFVIYGDVREVYLAPDGRRFSARGEEVVRGTWDDYSAQPCYPSKDVVAAAKAPRPQSVQRT